MIDRSPQGRLEVAGPPLRYMHQCNWKMLVETRPTPAIRWWRMKARPAPPARSGSPPEGTGMKKPMAVEIFLPFVSP